MVSFCLLHEMAVDFLILRIEKLRPLVAELVSGAVGPGTQPGSRTPALKPGFSRAARPGPASRELHSPPRSSCPGGLSGLPSPLPAAVWALSPPPGLSDWPPRPLPRGPRMRLCQPLRSAWAFCFSQSGEKGKDRRTGPVAQPKQSLPGSVRQFPLLINGFNTSPLSPGAEGR